MQRLYQKVNVVLVVAAKKASLAFSKILGSNMITEDTHCAHSQEVRIRSYSALNRTNCVVKRQRGFMLPLVPHPTIRDGSRLA